MCDTDRSNIFINNLKELFVSKKTRDTNVPVILVLRVYSHWLTPYPVYHHIQHQSTLCIHITLHIAYTILNITPNRDTPAPTQTHTHIHTHSNTPQLSARSAPVHHRPNLHSSAHLRTYPHCFFGVAEVVLHDELPGICIVNIAHKTYNLNKGKLKHEQMLDIRTQKHNRKKLNWNDDYVLVYLRD